MQNKLLAIRYITQGRKTYIVSILMVLIGIVNLITGDVSLNQFLTSPDFLIITNGLGIGFLRAAINKV
jgi:hypothetical protein